MSNPTSLDQLPAGYCATLINFQETRAVSNRLASLGFTPGADLRMTQNFGSGPLIVTVRGTRVALGRGEAAKILVRWSAR